MTKTLQYMDVEQSLVRDFLSAAIVHAEYCASLVVAALENFGIIPSRKKSTVRTVGLPKVFLAECAAVMELGCWERSGIRDHIDSGLPSYGEAAGHLASRCKLGPNEFVDPQSSTLSLRVFRFWLTRFTWGGLEILGGGVIIRGVDEDVFAELIADFLWRNRDSVSMIADGQKGNL